MKNIVTVIIVLVILVGGFVGYKAYKQNKATQMMQTTQQYQTQSQSSGNTTASVSGPADDEASLDADFDSNSLDQSVLSDTTADSDLALQ